jgi:hypothetical protein
MIITVVLRSGEGSYRFEKSEQHVGSQSTSAKGAEYKSQGQAPNNVRRVAPGYEE